MDRRKLKFKSSLHKNISSLSSQSSVRSDALAEPVYHFSTQKSASQKRKVSNDDSDNEPHTSVQAGDTKRKRNELQSTPKSQNIQVTQKSQTTLATQKSQISQKTQPKTLEITPRKKLSTRVLNKTSGSVSSQDESIRGKETITKSPVIQTQNPFFEFLRDSGITFISNGSYSTNESISMIKKRMKELLNSGQYKQREIVKSLEEYIENEENLKSMLNDIDVSDNNRIFNSLNNLSLARVLLQIPNLQSSVCNCFLSKLNECILLADSIEKVPWCHLLLQQFRFLEIVRDSNSLIDNLEQLLESCPLWFQRELILYLPDIVTDNQHQPIAEILSKLMEGNTELTNVILDCISNLTLGKEYLEEYRDRVLDLLKKNTERSIIPAIIRFVLNECVNMDTFKKVLTVLRDIDIQPLAGEKLEECYKNQLHIVNVLKINILLSRDMANTAVTIIKSINEHPNPMDIILLLLIYSIVAKRKIVEMIFKQHIRSGFYRQSLLRLLYEDYKEVVQDLQPIALQVASNLLKAEERVFVDFGIDWLRLQFTGQKELVFKQREIIEKIILLMGNNDQTARNALKFLYQMASNEEERNYLQAHSNHLKILLDKMDNLDLVEVGTLNDLLHNLCTNSDSLSNSLHDDLFIVLQKQLSSTKPLIKCKGVMGAVMAIKHLAQKSETCDTAHHLFKKVLTNVKSCLRSYALFYDQLTQVIAHTEEMNAKFLQNITNYIEEEFINTYMVDKSTYTGNLIPKYGLNNAEDEPQNCVLNFGNKKYGAIVPVSFKLLKTCYLRLSESGDLEAIDALLGCAIFMPQDLEIPDPSVLDLIIYCINWFREVISGFVTQTDPLLQKQVLKRLDNLMHLQGEFSTLLNLCDAKYQPPPCYFHYFPIPQFSKIEKKQGKKKKKEGKKERKKRKSIHALEMEPWEIGSTLCYKNPAYFRKLDAKIIHLLDTKMVLVSSQRPVQNVSITQVCFVVKELLGIFENEPSEIFVRDLIHLLPKVCAKLQDIVNKLREEDNNQNKEAARLLLCLLTTIFSWKGFQSVTYNPLLREGLRTLAGQINEGNAMLRSCKELVAESCKYFESLSDIATRILLATALVNMCRTLMKHSETYTQQYKEKHAKMAFGFLSLEWSEDKHSGLSYKTAIVGLLNDWIDNESSPLNTVTTVLEWLIDEIPKLEKPQDNLSRLPSISKSNFHLLYKKLFDGLIKGVRISLTSVDRDPKRVEIWQNVSLNVQTLVQICKIFKTKSNILLFLRYMPLLVKFFISNGMPILEHNLKYQMTEVTAILKSMQGGTRYLHAICCDCTEKKDITLMKYVPAAKSVLEKLVYSVKGMLVLNNSASAFWMGNLVNKNLDGHEILSQTSTENSLQDSNTVNDDLTYASSEVLDSDIDDHISLALYI